MKPKFKMEHLSEGITLYLGDCRDIFSSLREIDAVVTDPPYGISESNKNFASRGKIAPPNIYERLHWDKSPCTSDTISWMLANSNVQIIWGGNYFNLPPTRCFLIWDKMGPANDFADCELAWTNMSRAVRRIRYLWNGCMRMEKEKRTHPTQKPIGVMEWCLDFIPEAKVILDPFMGSGTTGVACVKLNRKFIGIEIEPTYFDIACKRIEKALKEPNLFQEVPIKRKRRNFGETWGV